MDEEEDYPKGRASSLFMFVVLSGITLVLSLAHWLSDLHISLAPLYAWEILLFVFTLASIVCFVVLQNNNDHVVVGNDVRDVDQSTEIELTNSVIAERLYGGKTCEPLWMRIPIRFFALTACCIGSLSMPVYETYRTIDNLSCFNIESIGLLAVMKLKCISTVLYILTCVSMSGFLLRFRNKSSKSSEMKVLMSSLAATNMALTINVIMNIIWTSNTMEVNSEKPLHNITKINTQVNMTEAELVKEMIYLKCKDNVGYVDTIATYFYKYSYQFPVEFALLSFCFLGGIWNILPQRKRARERVQPEERNSSTDSENHDRNTDTVGHAVQRDPEREPLIERRPSQRLPARLRKLRLGGKSTFLFICNHITISTALVVVGIFAFHLYTEIKDDTFDDENVILHCDEKNKTCVDSQNSIIQTVYIYVISIVAFIGFMVARKESKSYDIFHAIDILLLICTGGRLILILFETIDNVEIIVENTTDNTVAEKVLFSFKTFCRFIGLYSQTILVLKISKIKISQKSMKTGKQLFIKAIVAFLGVCNMEIWLADSFLEPTVLQYNDNTNYGQSYGHKNWFFLTQLLYPFLTLYRLLTAVMCYEACVRFKRKQMQDSSMFRSTEQAE